jgi:aminotransferase
VHDFLTVGAPAPLQSAGAVGLGFGPDYYASLSQEYCERRELLCPALREAGFRFSTPEGAYYVLTDFSQIRDQDDREFALWLARDIGIATVPGSSFYSSGGGKRMTRFAFCKKRDTLEQAVERLGRLAR